MITEEEKAKYKYFVTMVNHESGEVIEFWCNDDPARRIRKYIRIHAKYDNTKFDTITVIIQG